MCSASNVKLAETLQTVANEGARAFYDPSSALAQNLVKDIQAKGGIVTLEDLSSYYHNFTVKVSSRAVLLLLVLFLFLFLLLFINYYLTFMRRALSSRRSESRSARSTRATR